MCYAIYLKTVFTVGIFICIVATLSISRIWNLTEYTPSDVHLDTDHVSTQTATTTSTNSFTVRAKVLSFIDECNKYYCPEGAICEPCHSRIHILTDDGKNISILPPTGSYSFENFHIVKGEEFIFKLSFTPYEGGLVHYRLISLQNILK